MKRTLLLGAAIVLCVAVRAERLGETVDLTPVKGWHSAPPSQPSPLPTVEFAPDDSRNARLLITLVPVKPGALADEASLKQFHRLLCQSWLRSTDQNDLQQNPLVLSAGRAVYTSFEDPDLVGKPIKRDDFKFATAIAVYLPPTTALHVTLLTNSITASEFKEGLEIVRSAALVAKVTSNPVSPGSHGASILVGVGDNVLITTLPTQSLPRVRTEPNYFYVAAPNDVLISGWLEPAKKYAGFRAFWTTEKRALEEHGTKVEHESVKMIGEWNAVLFSNPLDANVVQSNIRACRVRGTIWADVHLSRIGPAPDWTELESALKTLNLGTKL